MADAPQDRYAELAEEPGTEATSIPTTAPETTIEALQTAFGAAIREVRVQHGQTAVTLEAKALLDVARWLRDERDFALLSDVTAQDCGSDPRFVVVYHLRCISRPELLRLRVGLSEKKPRVASVTGLWPGADFPEREVYDLFGIEFEGHPNLKRILMPDDWDGHPLRKDYPLVYEPVAFTHNADEVHSKKPFARE